MVLSFPFLSCKVGVPSQIRYAVQYNGRRVEEDARRAILNYRSDLHIFTSLAQSTSASPSWTSGTLEELKPEKAWGRPTFAWDDRGCSFRGEDTGDVFSCFHCWAWAFLSCLMRQWCLVCSCGGSRGCGTRRHEVSEVSLKKGEFFSE